MLSNSRFNRSKGEGKNVTVDFERPIGRKAENANWKRKDDEKYFLAKYLKKKLKILEKSCAYEKEKVCIKAEKGLLARVEKEWKNYDDRHKCYEQTTKLLYDTLQSKSLQNKVWVVRWVEIMLAMSCFNFILVVAYFRSWFVFCDIFW